MSMTRSSSGASALRGRTVVALACVLPAGCASAERTGAQVPTGAPSDWRNRTYTVTCDGIVPDGFRARRRRQRACRRRREPTVPLRLLRHQGHGHGHRGRGRRRCARHRRPAGVLAAAIQRHPSGGPGLLVHRSFPASHRALALRREGVRAGGVVTDTCDVPAARAEFPSPRTCLPNRPEDRELRDFRPVTGRRSPVDGGPVADRQATSARSIRSARRGGGGPLGGSWTGERP
jgi:hypothetical protein